MIDSKLTIKKETNLFKKETSILQKAIGNKKNDVILTFDMMKKFEGKLPGQKAFEWDGLNEYKEYQNRLDNNSNSFHIEEINDSIVTQNETSYKNLEEFSLLKIKNLNEFDSNENLELKRYKQFHKLSETKSEKEDRDMLNDLDSFESFPNKNKNYIRRKLSDQIEM